MKTTRTILSALLASVLSTCAAHAQFGSGIVYDPTQRPCSATASAGGEPTSEMDNGTQRLAGAPAERSPDLHDRGTDPNPDRHHVQPGLPDVDDAAKSGREI